MKGLVVASFGRQYSVEIEGRTFSCPRRGKKTDVVVGDRVIVDAQCSVIESIEPRDSLLYRSDSFREKRIAANLTQVVFVLAAFPTFSEELLNLCLIAAEDQRLKILVVLNKADMTGETEAAKKILTPYEALGYKVLALSAKTDISPLLPHLQGERSVLVGQSGMGKSTIVNALIPESKRATGEISEALDSGRHTTTHAMLFHLGPDSDIVDSPGLQEFGLHHMDPERLALAFPEFRPHLGHCRFRNCRHLEEPGCALQAAMQEGKIGQARLVLYRKIAARLHLPKFRKGPSEK